MESDKNDDIEKDEDEEGVSNDIVREKYVAVLFYIGFGFCGWQKQAPEPNAKPGKYVYIQECLEDSVTLSVPQSVGVSALGSGRTDAGTHASGQVVHFIIKYPASSPILPPRDEWTPEQWTTHCESLLKEINLHLPREIRVLHLFRFPIHFPPSLPFFHARKSAQWKQYSYYIQQGGVYRVDWAPFCLFVKEKLNIDQLKRELATIKGEHDFQNFVNDSKNPPGKTRLTISSIELSFLHSLNPSFPTSPSLVSQSCNNASSPPPYLSEHPQPPLKEGQEKPYIIRIRINGSGFLRHMVRRIIGSLQWIANGKKEEGLFTRVLNDGLDEVKTEEEEKAEQGDDNESRHKRKKVEHVDSVQKAEDSMEQKKGKEQNEEVKKENEQNEKNGGEQKELPARRSQRNKHRLNKVPKKTRKEFLGPAAPARGLWLEKVWYGEDWCIQPEKLQLGFSPFVDCSFTTSV